MATPKNQSVVKAFTILRSFRRPDERLTSAELSRRAKLPEASGYRLIQTLTEIGAVVRGRQGRYRLGMLLVSLSSNVAIGDLLRDVSQQILRDLASRLALTVHVGMLEDDMVTYVAKVGDPTIFAVHTRVGAKLEAYCSGLGKGLLAALPPDALESYILGGNLIPLTSHTITDPTELRAELKRVRDRGYAIDDQVSSLDLFCMAVPILGTDGRTVAAISVSDDATRMTDLRQEEVRAALFGAAQAISALVSPNGDKSVPAARLEPR